MRTINLNGQTVGDTITALAKEFSKEADTMGLFILEQAYKEAKELKSQEQRHEEFDALMLRIKRTPVSTLSDKELEDQINAFDPHDESPRLDDLLHEASSRACDQAEANQERLIAQEQGAPLEQD